MEHHSTAYYKYTPEQVASIVNYLGHNPFLGPKDASFTDRMDSILRRTSTFKALGSGVPTQHGLEHMADVRGDFPTLPGQPQQVSMPEYPAQAHPQYGLSYSNVVAQEPAWDHSRESSGSSWVGSQPTDSTDHSMHAYEYGMPAPVPLGSYMPQYPVSPGFDPQGFESSSNGPPFVPSTQMYGPPEYPPLGYLGPAFDPSGYQDFPTYPSQEYPHGSAQHCVELPGYEPAGYIGPGYMPPVAVPKDSWAAVTSGSTGEYFDRAHDLAADIGIANRTEEKPHVPDIPGVKVTIVQNETRHSKNNKQQPSIEHSAKPMTPKRGGLGESKWSNTKSPGHGGIGESKWSDRKVQKSSPKSEKSAGNVTIIKKEAPKQNVTTGDGKVLEKANPKVNLPKIDKVWKQRIEEQITQAAVKSGTPKQTSIGLEQNAKLLTTPLTKPVFAANDALVTTKEESSDNKSFTTSPPKSTEPAGNEKIDPPSITTFSTSDMDNRTSNTTMPQDGLEPSKKAKNRRRTHKQVVDSKKRQAVAERLQTEGLSHSEAQQRARDIVYGNLSTGADSSAAPDTTSNQVQETREAQIKELESQAGQTNEPELEISDSREQQPDVNLPEEKSIVQELQAEMVETQAFESTEPVAEEVSLQEKELPESEAKSEAEPDTQTSAVPNQEEGRDWATLCEDELVDLPMDICTSSSEDGTHTPNTETSEEGREGSIIEHEVTVMKPEQVQSGTPAALEELSAAPTAPVNTVEPEGGVQPMNTAQEDVLQDQDSNECSSLEILETPQAVDQYCLEIDEKSERKSTDAQVVTQHISTEEIDQTPTSVDHEAIEPSEKKLTKNQRKKAKARAKVKAKSKALQDEDAPPQSAPSNASTDATSPTSDKSMPTMMGRYVVSKPDSKLSKSSSDQYRLSSSALGNFASESLALPSSSTKKSIEPKPATIPNAPSSNTAISAPERPAKSQYQGISDSRHAFTFKKDASLTNHLYFHPPLRGNNTTGSVFASVQAPSKIINSPNHETKRVNTGRAVANSWAERRNEAYFFEPMPPSIPTATETPASANESTKCISTPTDAVPDSPSGTPLEPSLVVARQLTGAQQVGQESSSDEDPAQKTVETTVTTNTAIVAVKSVSPRIETSTASCSTVFSRPSKRSSSHSGALRKLLSLYTIWPVLSFAAPIPREYTLPSIPRSDAIAVPPPTFNQPILPQATNYTVIDALKVATLAKYLENSYFGIPAYTDNEIPDVTCNETSNLALRSFRTSAFEELLELCTAVTRLLKTGNNTSLASVHTTKFTAEGSKIIVPAIEDPVRQSLGFTSRGATRDLLLSSFDVSLLKQTLIPADFPLASPLIVLPQPVLKSPLVVETPQPTEPEVAEAVQTVELECAFEDDVVSDGSDSLGSIAAEEARQEVPKLNFSSTVTLWDVPSTIPRKCNKPSTHSRSSGFGFRFIDHWLTSISETASTNIVQTKGASSWWKRLFKKNLQLASSGLRIGIAVIAMTTYFATAPAVLMNRAAAHLLARN